MAADAATSSYPRPERRGFTEDLKMQALVEELQRADEEANKLRPRLRYLEEVMVRADGALNVLKGLLEEETPASVNHAGVSP